MSEKEFFNRHITQTVVVKDLLASVSIGTFQEDFPLREADFLRLTRNDNGWNTWALNSFFAAVGFGASVTPKLIAHFMGSPESLSSGEWLTFSILLALAGILYFVGRTLPGERTEVVKRISEHFKAAPRKRQMFREHE